MDIKYTVKNFCFHIKNRVVELWKSQWKKWKYLLVLLAVMAFEQIWLTDAMKRRHCTAVWRCLYKMIENKNNKTKIYNFLQIAFSALHLLEDCLMCSPVFNKLNYRWSREEQQFFLIYIYICILIFIYIYFICIYV